MPSLPEMLRAATWDLHASAEQAGVMGELLRGRLPKARYVALLRNLHALYDALEARTLPVPCLQRTEALAADLDALHGSGWAAAHPLAGAAHEYRRRLACASTAALAAHAYVRYLGDLHGGQALAALVQRAYGLSASGPGLSFYAFGPAPRVAELRREFRQALGELPFGSAEQAEAGIEARWAFEQHIRLFHELAA
jgi:heme oxygenase